MMEKYILLRIIEQLNKKWSILVPRVNLNLYLGTGALGHARWRCHGISCIDVLHHIFYISHSVSYKNIKFYNCQI